MFWQFETNWQWSVFYKIITFLFLIQRYTALLPSLSRAVLSYIHQAPRCFDSEIQKCDINICFVLFYVLCFDLWLSLALYPWANCIWKTTAHIENKTFEISIFIFLFPLQSEFNSQTIQLASKRLMALTALITPHASSFLYQHSFKHIR